MVVEVSMMKFNHERLPGSWFGQTGEVEVPLFQLVKTMTVKGAKTPAYQIDVFGKEKRNHKVWLCECKYTKTTMDLKQVKKLESAAQVLIQVHKEEGTAVPEIHIKLVSTGGFTKEVLTYIDSRADIYYSDYEGINQLFKAYGGNYSIPQFEINEFLEMKNIPSSTSYVAAPQLNSPQGATILTGLIHCTLGDLYITYCFLFFLCRTRLINRDKVEYRRLKALKTQYNDKQ
jgi:hypothetical protein